MAKKYSFSGASNGLNPPIILVRGVTYTFNVTSTGHPLWIKTSRTTGTGNAYSTGVTNNGASSGAITFVVPQDAPNILYYVSENDASLSNEIYVVNSTISIIGNTYSQGNNILSGSLTITGSLTVTGSSYLTGSSFTTGSNYVTGSSYITGSQIITGSLFVTGSSYLTGSTNILGNLNVSGSTIISGSHRISGSLEVTGSAFMDGTLTVKTIVAQIVTSSTTYDSGSNIFGKLHTDTHQFTGSVLISGSLNVIDPVINQLTASYAILTNNSINALTASLIKPFTAGTTENRIVVADVDGYFKYRTDLSLQGTQGTQGIAGTGSQGAEGIGTQGTQGTQGIIGTLGPQGTAGASGATNGDSYLHVQGSASTTWTIVHNLGQQYPAITVYDNTNEVILPSTITGTSSTTTTITFPTAKSGWAMLTFGVGVQGTSGSQGPQGTQGTSGSQGPQGLDGAYAAQGVQGPQGPAASTAGFITNTADTYGSVKVESVVTLTQTQYNGISPDPNTLYIIV